MHVSTCKMHPLCMLDTFTIHMAVEPQHYRTSCLNGKGASLSPLSASTSELCYFLLP